MKLVVDEWMSLDGVVQSPTTPDEDPSGGFTLGGWHVPYFEATAQQWILDGIRAADAYLFGRFTFGKFAAHWPHASPAEQVIAEPLNTRPKYVAASSGGLADWANTTRLDGDVVTAVGKRLFPAGDPGVRAFHLSGSTATPAGALLVTYDRAI